MLDLQQPPSRACRQLHEAAEKRRRRVRYDLAKDAGVFACVTLERGAGRMAMRRSGSPLCGVDVGLGDERIEEKRQQHYAQYECASRRHREAAGLCSLFRRQQWNTRRCERSC
jgi:hypothetical protein